MERIIQIWQRVYFTEPILIYVLLLTLIVSIMKRRTVPGFRWLPVYLGLFLLFFAVDYAYTIFHFPAHQEQFQKYQREINFYVTVVEMLVFLSFFLSNLRNASVRKMVKYLGAITLTAFLFIYINTHARHGHITYSNLNLVYIIELAALLSCCVLFFIQMFKEPPVSNLRNMPGFWVASGLSFYCLCTLPLTIANSYFFYNARGLIYANLYSIIYLFYILLFILITRSFLCPRPGTT